MGLFKGFRTRTAKRFRAATGSEPQIADLAAIAMHPFANRQRPVSREMEKTIRTISWAFSRESRGIDDPEQLRVEARRAVRLYLQQAERAEDRHYIESYRNALDAIAREGESAGIVFYPDSIEERRLNVCTSYPQLAKLPAERLLLPDRLRGHAIALLLKNVPDPRLTADNAGRWIDWASLKDRWHGGWIEEEPERPYEPVAGQPGVFIARDMDASVAVWHVLSEAGLDSRHLKDTPPDD